MIFAQKLLFEKFTLSHENAAIEEVVLISITFVCTASQAWLNSIVYEPIRCE